MYGKIDYDPLTDQMKCEICSKWFSNLVYHVSNSHGVSAKDYRYKFGLPARIKLTSKAFRAQKRLAMVKNGNIHWSKGADPRTARIGHKWRVPPNLAANSLRNLKPNKKKKS